MAYPANYAVDIVSRTKDLLCSESYTKAEQDGLEVTFLINCLLGLIIAVSETEKKKKTSWVKKNINTDLTVLIPEQIAFTKKPQVSSLIEAKGSLLSYQILGKDDLKEKTVQWLVNKLRNSIAHQNIEAIDINNNGKWTGIKMWNQPVTGSEERDFEVIFTTNQLREVSIYFADTFIGSHTENAA